MKVLITGSRHYRNAEAINGHMAVYADCTFVVGDCPAGADRIAREICRAQGWPYEIFTADWSVGRRAGPERNQRMVDACGTGDVCVAFFTEDACRGTWDCHDRALKLGLVCERFGTRGEYLTDEGMEL